MKAREAYEFLSFKLSGIYGDREAAITARYLIEDLFGLNFWSEEELTFEQNNLLSSSIKKLLNYEPWQYVAGQADFYGLKFFVNKSVLIPRPETEELVHLALYQIKTNKINSIFDIGTGSGVIPITIAVKSNIDSIYALDISREALLTATMNNEKHKSKVSFIHCDFLDRSCWELLPKSDMIISNPPYITQSEKEEMHANVLNFEPNIALFVREDAMEFYHAIAEFVQVNQENGCRFMVEINEKYGLEVKKIFIAAGMKEVEVHQDMQGKDRIVTGIKANL